MTKIKKGYSGRAHFSKNRRYRFWLSRIKKGFEDKPLLLVIMLNPSKANEHLDDNTIAKLYTFTEKAGDFGGFIVVNLFAFITKCSKELLKCHDPVGSIEGFSNNYLISVQMKKCKKILVAWGENGAFLDRGKKICGIIKFMDRQNDVICLGKNNSGNPKHPSRLPYNTPIIKFDVENYVKTTKGRIA